MRWTSFTRKRLTRFATSSKICLKTSRLFENRCREAKAKDLGNGRWEVTIKVECAKLKADDLGKETEVKLNDYIEIGAFAEPEKGKTYGKTLHRQRVKVTQKTNTFTFVWFKV
jgi:ABC-2 type transport system permease protein